MVLLLVSSGVMQLQLSGADLGPEVLSGFTHMSGTSAEMSGPDRDWLGVSFSLCTYLQQNSWTFLRWFKSPKRVKAEEASIPLVA